MEDADNYDDEYIGDIQDALDVLDDTKEPAATDEEKEAAVEALEELLNAENQDANKLCTITFNVIKSADS
ncbi:MAG: hypothetical protein IKN72_09240 [Clostridia bacterium]|nr:hypothetical protein [Clostridia bacterium]MBR3553554.1 hypothetical protein [Clostridia bacterium]